MDEVDILDVAEAVATAASATAVRAALDRYRAALAIWQRATWNYPLTSPQYRAALQNARDAFAELSADWALHYGRPLGGR